MTLDRAARVLLARAVGACRDILSDDLREQLQSSFGFQPDGSAISSDRLPLDAEGRSIAEALRSWHAHLVTALPAADLARSTIALERMVQECGFTALNRLVAVRIAEERGLLPESVRRGAESDGPLLFERISNGALGDRERTYEHYLHLLFAELAVDLGVLFASDHANALLFPRHRALADVLDQLNASDLGFLWMSDETIGWVYQYFNSSDEIRAMRKASSTPRTGRELAVRNQFFTPRFVVEFLTDNTLGRIWYEMRKGRTGLTEQCRMLVRHPNERFLGIGEKARAKYPTATASQDELLGAPDEIPYRALRDPRDLRILDPASGSGHFLLYAFDLLQLIYEEAWEDDSSPVWKQTGSSLRRDYPDRDDFRRQIPALILRHNLYGIDIDPRACQIAALALWLRAQRRYQELDLAAAVRPAITRTNIVCAEPMPGDRPILDNFIGTLTPPILGTLVRSVWERMKLAGEAGSLLKIDEDLRDEIAKAKIAWDRRPKAEQRQLFTPQGAEQPELFESAITDARFWEEAEDRLLEALTTYGKQASGAAQTSRRLFAEDAVEGLAFIDLCQQRYDVVLMNPPFGDFSRGFKSQARSIYPNTYNDIFAAFTECFLGRLNAGGLLGAITSRAGFFLGSFESWRTKVLLEQGSLRILADLGERVMDNAMVEAAAYVLGTGGPRPRAITVFRLLGVSERDVALADTINQVRAGTRTEPLILARERQFSLLPGSPFAYWVSESIMKKLTVYPTFEPAGADIRVGLQTGDNFRFVRAVWEPQPAAVITGEEATPGRGARLGRWAFLVLAGSSQPWFAPITALVLWADNGAEIANFVDEATGRPRSRVQNTAYFFRPGFSWTLRAVRLVPHVVPAGCIATVSRYVAYPTRGHELTALAAAASNLASAYTRFRGEKFAWPKFLVENVRGIPWAVADGRLGFERLEFVRRQIGDRRTAYRHHEPFQEFVAPWLRHDPHAGDALHYDLRSLLGEELDHQIAELYGLSSSEETELYRDLHEALDARRAPARPSEDEEGSDDEGEGEEAGEEVLASDPYSHWEALISYAVGCAFGRWDVRLALDASLVPPLPDAFAPLPACPPGMLVGPDGLPAQPDRLASEAWLRARADGANPLSSERAQEFSCGNAEYSLRVTWSGILVDDAAPTGTGLGPDGIASRVREVFALLWPSPDGSAATTAEVEACVVLDVPSLEEYLRRPTGFFADHLARYTKSRRQAPIYWPLSTSSGSYTLWLYYHRLSAELIFRAINSQLEPKIAETKRRIAALGLALAEGSARDRTRARDMFDETTELHAELDAFRTELLRVAGSYAPHFDDGVLISAAPLHSFFRLPIWRKKLSSTWEAIKGGSFDWSHLAYSIRPEQIRAQAKRDKSLAIAHGLTKGRS